MDLNEKLDICLQLTEAETRQHPFTKKWEVKDRAGRWVPHPYKNKPAKPTTTPITPITPITPAAPSVSKKATKCLGYGTNYLLDIVQPMHDEQPLKLPMETIDQLDIISGHIVGQLRMLNVPELATNVANAFKYIHSRIEIYNFEPAMEESETLGNALEIINNEIMNWFNAIEGYVTPEVWNHYDKIMDNIYEFIKEYLTQAYSPKIN